MTVEALPQYEIEPGILSFQWNLQNPSGKERLWIRSKEKRHKKTEFIRVKSLDRQDRDDRNSSARTNNNDPDYQIRSPFYTDTQLSPRGTSENL